MSNALHLQSVAITRRGAGEVNGTVVGWDHNLAAGCWLYHHEFLTGSQVTANSNIKHSPGMVPVTSLSVFQP